MLPPPMKSTSAQHWTPAQRSATSLCSTNPPWMDTKTKGRRQRHLLWQRVFCPGHLPHTLGCHTWIHLWKRREIYHLKQSMLQNWGVLHVVLFNLKENLHYPFVKPWLEASPAASPTGSTSLLQTPAHFPTLLI